MALRSRNKGWLGLALGGGLVLAVACSSSNKKQVVPAGDGGEAGAAEAGAPAGGAHAGGAHAGGSAGAAHEAGAAGEAQGGAAGSPTAEAGAGGDMSAAGAAGAAGQGPLACVPAGSVTNLTLPIDIVYSACRGAAVFAQFNAGTADKQFGCCGVSNASTPYSIDLTGFYNGDGGGQLGFTVPDDAAFGNQAISVTCSEGPAQHPIALNISELPAPIVASATTQIDSAGNMVVKGSHLGGVTSVSGVAANGNSYPCTIVTASSTDTSITCNFNGQIPVGKYSIVAYSNQCGYAVDTPSFVVVPIT